MLRMIVLSAASCCLLIAGCGSQDKSASGTAGAKGADPGANVEIQPDGGPWQEFRSPDGRFKVSFPGKWQKLDSDEGESRYGTQIGEVAGYTLLFTDIDAKPEDIENMLTTMRDGTVQKQKSLLESKAKVGDHPARDFAFVDETGDANFYRIFIVDGRLYQLVTVVGEKDFAARKADREKFLDSFEFIAK